MLVVNRLLDPGSEFRVHRQWYLNSAMDELMGTGFEVAEKDRLYRCLDRVLPHKQELFVYLKQKWADLFGADSKYCCTTSPARISKERSNRILKPGAAIAGTGGRIACNW